MDIVEEWFLSKQGEAYGSMYAFAKDAWAAAVSAEREACAKICETKGAIKYAGLTIGEQCAIAIRKRSNARSEARPVSIAYKLKGYCMNVEQALNAADEGEKEGLSGLYPTVGQVLAAEVRELRDTLANVRASAQMGGVYLQSARDGVWAHFGMNRKYYSVCLSNDAMSRPFAVEYATAHAKIVTPND